MGQPDDRTRYHLMAAEGTVVHAGRQSAVAEGKLLDVQGKLYATASTDCLLVDVPT